MLYLDIQILLHFFKAVTEAYPFVKLLAFILSSKLCKKYKKDLYSCPSIQKE